MKKELLDLEINHEDNKDIKTKINFILKESRVPNIWRTKVENLINIIEENASNKINK